MKRLSHAILLSSTVLMIAGCSGGADRSDSDPATEPGSEVAADAPSLPAPPSPPPPSPAPPAPSSATDDAGARQPETRVDPPREEVSQPPVAMPSPSEPATPPSPPPPAALPSIELSAGVALEQTTPSGTMMSFSVDYRFVQGGPDPSAQFVWVIEPGSGAPVRQPVRLTRNGTLQTLVPPWRSRHGPFRTHFEDARGNRISPSASLR